MNRNTLLTLFGVACLGFIAAPNADAGDRYYADDSSTDGYTDSYDNSRQPCYEYKGRHRCGGAEVVRCRRSICNRCCRGSAPKSNFYHPRYAYTYLCDHYPPFRYSYSPRPSSGK